MNKIKEIKLDQTNWLEVTWVKVEEEIETIIHCESFGDSDEYHDLLRQRCIEFGTEFNEEQLVILQEQVDNKHVPTEEEIVKQKEEQEAYRIKQIKAKANEIITSKYSIIWQLNHPRGVEEYKEAYAYIDAIRDISNKAEKDGLNVDEIDWSIK
ncbi:hypothetical protein [Aliarcobacter butzleri]|uniref:hypothetical protein n=1 Tax=Aliarcobacter butzleri TaxID=28197 RepID=UPI0021B21634|nr:hypothetical protein [Aliarcobacter butzleri]MCT7596436.1 hypothetical protein [Aliarcobacter butzleri]